MPSLFDPLQAGALHLKNRLVMAPLTRSRAGESRVPNALMATYYAQRASAGLIVSEATAISREGYGWRDAPGLYTRAMEEGWKPVTDAVHDKGGLIVLQLWHMGRLSHPELMDGDIPLAPSALAVDAEHRSIHKPYVTPRAMTLDDIKRTLDDFANAAQAALRAGFDGVEIHGANGYLIDQFLKDSSNRRTDSYGGDVPGRARFLMEVVEAVTKTVGSNRTGLRLSPDTVQYTGDSGFIDTFATVADLLNPFNLAYLHVKEPSRDQNGVPRVPPATKAMRDRYRPVMIVNEQYDAITAQQALDTHLADAVAFGTPFLANPDFVDRVRQNAPMNAPVPGTFYKGGAEGYTTYPVMDKTVVSRQP
jgi:2,4-dienoyl-CoA reductase-like NADH-dependent reductase (Old Yellow Enzyme family)